MPYSCGFQAPNQLFYSFRISLHFICTSVYHVLKAYSEKQTPSAGFQQYSMVSPCPLQNSRNLTSESAIRPVP
jgi:hypothetical protein